MKLTDKHKMMAVSAHANNELRIKRIHDFDMLDDNATKQCIACLFGDTEAEYTFSYNPGWPVGKLVRWLDSLRGE